MSYIPDITERFPEGFGGVDMTPSFFGEAVDWSRAYGYNDIDDEECYTEVDSEIKKFEIGKEYRDVEFDGGITIYTVIDINYEKNQILLAETWYNLDGSGKRPDSWHKLAIDDQGNEKALLWKSKTYGEVYLKA